MNYPNHATFRLELGVFRSEELLTDKPKRLFRLPFPASGLATGSFHGLHSKKQIPASVRSFAAMALLLVAAAVDARAAIMNYTLTGGTMSGSYTLDGTTTNFTNAAVTYAVSADSSLAVAGTGSQTGNPLYYLLVSSVTITLTEGSNTTIFSTGTQTIQYNGFTAPASMAVISYNVPSGGYSGIGFGAVDIVPNDDYPANSPANPWSTSMAQSLQAGSAIYTNLETPGSFEGINFVTVGSLEVSSGGQSGTLVRTSESGAATMTITAVTITAVPEPSSMIPTGIACGGGFLVRRRRKRD